jgi:hypothetical protein
MATSNLTSITDEVRMVTITISTLGCLRLPRSFPSAWRVSTAPTQSGWDHDSKAKRDELVADLMVSIISFDLCSRDLRRSIAGKALGA